MHSGWPQHCILKGHQGPVTCLLYPSTHSKSYQRDHVLSGGADFTVKFWNLYSGVLVHTFAVHGGKIKNIVSCPPDINVSYKKIARYQCELVFAYMCIANTLGTSSYFYDSDTAG